jgi:hypothetical protein
MYRHLNRVVLHLNGAINTQLKLIQEDGCIILDIAEARNGNVLILYTSTKRPDIYGRIVYPSGIATKRYVNDLAIFIEDKPHENAFNLQYIRILGDKINNGYGTIMMKRLLDIAREKQLSCIYGRMQETDNKEHEARLIHFYTKFGFAIDSGRNLLWRSKQPAQKGSL